MGNQYQWTLSAALALALVAVAAPAPASGDAGAGDVVVAVLDSGIESTHPEFAEHQLATWKDFVNGEAVPYDDHGQGTAVASRIAGATVGVDAGLTLAAAKVTDASGTPNPSVLADAIRWAVTDAGADVIVVTAWDGWQLNALDPHGVNAAVADARAHGVPVVWMAGDAGWGYSDGRLRLQGTENPPPFPSALLAGAGAEHALVVGAANATGAPVRYSSHAPHALAHGVDVPVAWPGGGIVTVSGSAYAAATAAALVAQVRADVPALIPDALREALLKTARGTAATPYYLEGYGVMDAATVQHALKVIHGDAPMPDRTADDAQHAAFQRLRATYGAQDAGNPLA